jgi:hypothetical protein
MKKAAKTKLPAIGAALGGGFFAGVINVGGKVFALVVAPKAEGQHADTPWHTSYDNVEGANSFNDGLANTKAMAKAGSAVAKWALGLKIGKFKDWYLPSQDELEICYRNLKPGTGENSGYARSGINLSAIPPTYPYTVDVAKQTKAKAFTAGGTEAFDEVYYWTSTQHASRSSLAWNQTFEDGFQGLWHKGYVTRARAVRRLAI